MGRGGECDVVSSVKFKLGGNQAFEVRPWRAGAVRACRASSVLSFRFRVFIRRMIGVDLFASFDLFIHL